MEGKENKQKSNGCQSRGLVCYVSRDLLEELLDYVIDIQNQHEWCRKSDIRFNKLKLARIEKHANMVRDLLGI